MSDNPWEDVDRAPVFTGKPIYRLAEWPCYYPTTEEFRAAMIETGTALLKAGKTVIGIPAVSIALPSTYAEARTVVLHVDQLFAALPATVRAEFSNDPLQLLIGLRDAGVRARLAEANVMLFEGEGDERIVGLRPDQHGAVITAPDHGGTNNAQEGPILFSQGRTEAQQTEQATGKARKREGR